MTEMKPQTYKIYEIYSDLIPITYIGCTKQTYLSKRLADHRRFKDCSSKKIFWFDERPKIRLLEEIDINTEKQKVALREKYHILENKDKVFNLRIPSRSKKEYYEEKKDTIREKKKIYRENNKEKIKEKKREYYLKNRENIIEKERIKRTITKLKEKLEQLQNKNDKMTKMTV